MLPRPGLESGNLNIFWPAGWVREGTENGEQKGKWKGKARKGRRMGEAGREGTPHGRTFAGAPLQASRLVIVVVVVVVVIVIGMAFVIVVFRHHKSHFLTRHCFHAGVERHFSTKNHAWFSRGRSLTQCAFDLHMMKGIFDR